MGEPSEEITAFDATGLQSDDGKEDLVCDWTEAEERKVVRKCVYT